MRRKTVGIEKTLKLNFLLEKCLAKFCVTIKTHFFKLNMLKTCLFDAKKTTATFYVTIKLIPLFPAYFNLNFLFFTSLLLKSHHLQSSNSVKLKIYPINVAADTPQYLASFCPKKNFFKQFQINFERRETFTSLSFIIFSLK